MHAAANRQSADTINLQGPSRAALQAAAAAVSFLCNPVGNYETVASAASSVTRYLIALRVVIAIEQLLYKDCINTSRAATAALLLYLSKRRNYGYGHSGEAPQLPHGSSNVWPQVARVARVARIETAPSGSH